MIKSQSVNGGLNTVYPLIYYSAGYFEALKNSRLPIGPGSFSNVKPDDFNALFTIPFTE